MRQQLAYLNGRRHNIERSNEIVPHVGIPNADGVPLNTKSVPSGSQPHVAAQTPPSVKAPSAAPTTPSYDDSNATPTTAIPTSHRAKTPHGHGPWKPIDKGTGGRFTETQQIHFDALVERFTAKTQESKRLTQKHRSRLADPRTVAGFRQQWKELVYPIWSDHAKGSKLWDVDGNEWLDITNGFGVTFFGHSPDFITDAISKQLAKTIAIGPQTLQVGEAAEMLCALTGMDRAAFCNTGSEAVLAAVRMARMVTGRDKIVTFADAYHGIFDEVLVRGVKVRGEIRPQPVAPGIPRSAVQNLIVLDYDEEASLEAIRAQAGELAAVLVEPVQSRNLKLQPRAFLQKLRALTEELDIPLIFDDMVMGFRLHPGGSQAYFGVQADIATYGKIIGGGMPIGVVAGKRRFLDSLDAGDWRFGDDSVPEAGVTWFAGTFVRHPLSIAAAHAVLTKLTEAGPELQQSVNAKTERFANEMNAWYDENQMPIRIIQFSSLFIIQFEGDNEYAPLYWHHLRDLGIHAHERRTNFLTTAHNEEDMARLAEACKEAARRLRDGGFLPKPRGDQSRTNGLGLEQVQANQASGLPGEWQAPATEEQTELFVACQMGHDASCAFNLSYSMHFRGKFQVEAMRHAISEIVNRHDSLRMRMSVTGETLFFSPSLEIEIPFLDWMSSADKETQQRLSQIISEELENEYDLMNGPLVRAQVIRLEQDHHCVLFGVHHIASDGFSVGILMREIAEIYNAQSKNAAAELPAPTQYTEYAEWQSAERHTPEFAAAEAWWVEHVSQPCLPPPLELPTDRPRPPRKTFASAPMLTRITPELCADLKKTGMQSGCTTFSTLFGGFALWLHRLTGQDDVIIGVPASGQSMMGRARLVGHCAHHHPLRSQISWDLSVTDYIKAMQASVLDAYEHRNYTEGALLPKLQLPRDPSRLAMINVQFNLDPAPLHADFDGLESDIANNGRHYNAPDMTVNLVEDQDGSMLIRCEYNTDLFDAATIGRWLEGFQVALQAIVDDPTQSVSDVPVLSQEEQRLLLPVASQVPALDRTPNESPATTTPSAATASSPDIGWNNTDAPVPVFQSVHEWIEQSAAQYPDSPAVVIPGSRTAPEFVLTYRDMNARANRLARRLQRDGVAIGDLVAICLPRTSDLHVAMLAVWKSGAAYVPMDPGFPAERLEQMLGDSHASALITHSTIAPDLESGDARICCLDGIDGPSASTEDLENLNVKIPSNGLAYVIYTSGSTGRPKGVEIPHRAVLNFLASMAVNPGFDASDSLLAVTTFSFDIAVLELLLPLCVGGQVVLAASEDVYDGERLSQLIESHEITLMQATPSTWRLLLEAGWEGSPKLRALCGGEALPADLADTLSRCCPSLFNMYGPTETTIWSTMVKIDSGRRPITIGRPIANTQVYILDPRNKPVPIGAIGELCIGGEGLARGYRGLPEMTAERFMANPFSEANPEETQGRLYRTGDLARFRSNGEIECLGRLDSQIKLRGFRIELGDIESAIESHPMVGSTSVLAREDVPGEKRLVAYVVAATTEPPSMAELRTHLQERLPDYMIPSILVALDKMPVTPNGKTDRKALPAPSRKRPELEQAYVGPRSRLERYICKSWSDLVEIDGIGIRDRFFDLGRKLDSRSGVHSSNRKGIDRKNLHRFNL